MTILFNLLTLCRSSMACGFYTVTPVTVEWSAVARDTTDVAEARGRRIESVGRSLRPTHSRSCSRSISSESRQEGCSYSISGYVQVIKFD